MTNSASANVRRFLALLLATLREIFDESSYERFLEQKQLASSAASYAEFCREREPGQLRRPRCC